MRIESPPPADAARRGLDGLFARMLVKAMRATLREDGPLSGGPGARLFGQVLEEALADALAGGGPRPSAPPRLPIP